MKRRNFLMMLFAPFVIPKEVPKEVDTIEKRVTKLYRFQPMTYNEIQKYLNGIEKKFANRRAGGIESKIIEEILKDRGHE